MRVIYVTKQYLSQLLIKQITGFNNYPYLLSYFILLKYYLV